MAAELTSQLSYLQEFLTEENLRVLKEIAEDKRILENQPSLILETNNSPEVWEWKDGKYRLSFSLEGLPCHQLKKVAPLGKPNSPGCPYLVSYTNEGTDIVSIFRTEEGKRQEDKILTTTPFRSYFVVIPKEYGNLAVVTNSDEDEVEVLKIDTRGEVLEKICSEHVGYGDLHLLDPDRGIFISSTTGSDIWYLNDNVPSVLERGHFTFYSVIRGLCLMREATNSMFTRGNWFLRKYDRYVEVKRHLEPEEDVFLKTVLEINENLRCVLLSGSRYMTQERKSKNVDIFELKRNSPVHLQTIELPGSILDNPPVPISNDTFLVKFGISGLESAGFRVFKFHENSKTRQYREVQTVHNTFKSICGTFPGRDLQNIEFLRKQMTPIPAEVADIVSAFI